MIDKTCINKICRDFDLPFAVNSIADFDRVFNKYREAVHADSEENKNLDDVEEMVVFLKQLDIRLGSKGFNVDILGNLRHEFVEFIWNSLKGEYSTEAKALYDKFNTQDMNVKYPLMKLQIPNGDVYNMENIDKAFISVDMSKAAFQAFYHQDPAILHNCEEWNSYVDYMLDEFVKFCNAKEDPTGKYKLLTEEHDVRYYLFFYVSNSRNIRQVIFGKTNGVRLCHIEKHIMQAVYSSIMSTFPTAKAVKFCNDEIIFEYTPELYDFIANNFVDGLQYVKLKVEAFELGAMKLKQIVEGDTNTRELNGIIVRKRFNQNGNIVSFNFKCCPGQYRYIANKLFKYEEKIQCIAEPRELVSAEINGFLFVLDGVIDGERFNIFDI